MSSASSHHILSIALLSCLICSYASADVSSDIDSILKNMESAYKRVRDYQTDVEVNTYKGEGSFETQRFLYTFKKPKSIRLDLESPHHGATMVYPDRNGQVAVRLPGLAHFLKFHLSLNNPLLGGTGQRIDQTDLGLLIENISHSLTDQRRGPVDVTEGGGNIRIRVLAEDHFRKGVVTLYHFMVDETSWLPIKVEESSPDGRLERTITFHDLRTNRGVPDSYFQLDGG